MRACGINILSAVKWPVLFGVLCTLLGFWINNEIVPRGHEIRRTLKNRVSVRTGISILEPGRVIDDFPKVKIYFSRKEGNWLHDLVVLDYSNANVDRLITADKALVTQTGADVNLELYHMTVDPVDDKHRTMARANRFVYTMKNVIKDTTYTKRLKDFRFFEMREQIADQERAVAAMKPQDRKEEVKREFALRELSGFKVELNKRFVFAMASICFVLIGIPLGIRSQRKESTIGMAISLAVSLGYYVMVILMLSCEESYVVRPWLVIWLPVLLCGGLAAHFMRKHL